MTDNEGPDAVEAESTPESEAQADAEAVERAVAEADGANADADADGDAEADVDADAGEAAATATEDAGPAAGERDEGVAEEVAELRRQNEQLRDRVSDLEAALEERAERVEDLTSRLKRKQADFQNYKKRAKKRQEQIRDRATEDLVERLLDVRDNLKRALEQDHDDVESIREGVKMTLSEFDRVLDAENVAEISPDSGDDVDPQRHEVMMRVDSEHPDGTIHEVYRPGYEMADKVLQTAQVTVSNGSDHDDEADDADADEDPIVAGDGSEDE